MSIGTWNASPGSNDYNTAGNWSPGTAPNAADANAFFGASTITDLSINHTGGLSLEVDAGGWIFNPGASNYSFTVGPAGFTDLVFFGAGIVVNGGSVSITIDSNCFVIFRNSSSAGIAPITVDGTLAFRDLSTASGANITAENGFVEFNDYSSAGAAAIHTLTGEHTTFSDFANGGSAEFITDAGGFVEFIASAGPAGDHHLTAGSIAGGGTYNLGHDQLTVGFNGLSTTVTGPIVESGFGAGDGSLVKVGRGRLTLSHAGNSYSGGTTLKAGIFDVAAVGAAGTGAITFAAGKQILRIEKGALTSHVFANPIVAFGPHDVIDLTGLRFHPGAHAALHLGSANLTVHSGSITDTLTLISSHGTHFATANDGHGGTDILLHA
jgi:autotransporter-associated beta strand protein